MRKVFIINGKRSPIGSFLGQFKSLTAVDLGTTVLKGLLENTKIPVQAIDEVIVGNILPAGGGQGIARQISINSGIGVEVPAYGVNMVCGSGMKAVMNAYGNISAGLHNLVVAGGVESMSSAPYLLPASFRTGVKMGEIKIVDHMLLDALTDPFDNIHMGMTAENIVDKYRISREEQDEFALATQEKAINAVDSGQFKAEIIPIVVKSRKGAELFDTDEYPNRTTNLEKLSKLRPAFKSDGSVTAGNSSGINDGASFTIIASEEMVERYRLKPLVEIIAIGQGGVSPHIMGMGPVAAIRDALKMANLALKDINIIELNEAFAAQSLGVITELAAEHNMSKTEIMERTNVNGGAIALGHPVGTSGNRIIVTLMHLMINRQAEYGLASLCIGGGMGTAVILKLVK